MTNVSPIPSMGPGPLPADHADDSAAFVDLTVQGSRLSASFQPPQVSVNGHLLPPGYGPRAVPVAPGQIKVDVFDGARRKGPASLEFSADTGQHVPVFYAPPLHRFASGSIGHEKQRRPGKRYLFSIPLVMILVYLALLAAVFFVFLRVADV